MFQIEFTSDAVDDLRTFRKSEQRTIFDQIGEQLSYEPEVDTRNRKKLRPNDVAKYELRIGKYRVFYDVDEQAQTVKNRSDWLQGGKPFVYTWQGVRFMKTVHVSTKAKTVTRLLKKAKKGGLILRSPEGHEFILAEIDDFDREIELTRQNKALMKLLDERGKQTKTLKSGDVKEQLGIE